MIWQLQVTNWKPNFLDNACFVWLVSNEKCETGIIILWNIYTGIIFTDWGVNNLIWSCLYLEFIGSRQISVWQDKNILPSRPGGILRKIESRQTSCSMCSNAKDCSRMGPVEKVSAHQKSCHCFTKVHQRLPCKKVRTFCVVKKL